MPDLQWLDGYCGEAVEQLISLEGKYRIDSLVLAFEQAMSQKAARVGMEGLSEEERIILAIEALEREVNNGGYSQFFINSPEYAATIVQSLRRIGCSTTAEITQKALTVVQQHPAVWESQRRIWEDNEKWFEVHHECNSLYFEHPENIEVQLFEFIKANRSRIEPLGG